MGTPVPFGSVLKSLFLCDLWNFCHHSSEKGGQERLEQQTFSGEERVKTDSYHAEFGCGCVHTPTTVHSMCLWLGEREERVVRHNIFFNLFAEWTLEESMHK